MVLVRSTFQVKFGHMDAVLAIMREYEDTEMAPGMASMLLTDASGQMFTLVVETRAESIDAYMDAMRAGFADRKTAEFMAKTGQHFESGRREFFNIEWEA